MTVATLALSLQRAEQQIDAALDRHDPRAFRLWCRKRASLIARIENGLARLALG